MTRDPSLKKYEDNRDVVRHEWRIDTRGEELVGHIALVKFRYTFSRPAETVWRYLKDFNKWQEDLQYNCVIGDQPEGATVFFTIKPEFHVHFGRVYGFDAKVFKKVSVVRKNVSGKLLVLEALSKDERKIDSYYIWALNESGGETTVEALMSYAPLWENRVSESTVRASYTAMSDEVEERWKTTYIPRLRQLVEVG